MSSVRAAGIAEHDQTGQTVNALSERVTVLETRTAPRKRRATKIGGRLLCRPDRCRYGYHPHAKYPWKLVEDFDEQQTVQIIRELARNHPEMRRGRFAALIRLGRKRRGKPWAGAHSARPKHIGAGKLTS